MKIPEHMQQRHGLPAEMSREQIEETAALATIELVKRGREGMLTTDQLEAALRWLERRSA